MTGIINYLIQGETVATALKGAYSQLKSLSEFSNAVYWSSHIMLGFDTTIDLPRLRYKLFTQVLDREVESVTQNRFTFRTMDAKDSKGMV